jgi:Response regulator of the LytR/AlgR family
MSVKFVKFFDRGEYIINSETILMIESSGNYIKIFFESKNKVNVISPLGRLKELDLPHEIFSRINRFNILNKSKVAFIQDNEITFKNGLRKALKGKCKLEML